MRILGIEGRVEGGVEGREGRRRGISREVLWYPSVSLYRVLSLPNRSHLLTLYLSFSPCPSLCLQPFSPRGGPSQIIVASLFRSHSASTPRYNFYRTLPIHPHSLWAGMSWKEVCLNLRRGVAGKWIRRGEVDDSRR